jgi:hypothetical protein
VIAANVPAATAIASTDCAALKSAFAGSVRFTASATTQPSTYAAIPGAGPNIRTIARANAADRVSSSLKAPLPGSLIGKSSPATTKPASTANVTGREPIDQPAATAGTSATTASSVSPAL